MKRKAPRKVSVSELIDVINEYSTERNVKKVSEKNGMSSLRLRTWLNKYQELDIEKMISKIDALENEVKKLKTSLQKESYAKGMYKRLLGANKHIDNGSIRYEESMDY